MNDEYIMIVPRQTPFKITFYGSYKVVISQDRRYFKVSTSDPVLRSKSYMLSLVSHLFNLPYIKRKDKTVQFYKLSEGVLCNA